MRIRVESQKLNEAIALASPATLQTSIIPALLCARFRFVPENVGNPAGLLELCCTNLDARVSVRVPCDLLDPGDGAFLLPARTLMSLTRLLPESDSVEITSANPTRVVLRAHGGEYEFNTPHPDDFPADIQARSEGDSPRSRLAVEISAPELARGIEATYYAMVNSQDHRYVLRSILFAFQEGRLELVATDGARLARATLPLQKLPVLEKPGDYVVPASAVDLLRRALGSVKQAQSAHLLFEEGCVLVAVDGSQGSPSAEIKAKLIDVRYPNYKPCLQLQPRTTATINRLELMNALRRIALVASDPRTFGVDIMLGPTLAIRAEHFSAGRARENVPTQSFSGEPQEFRLNYEYALQYLNKSHAEVVNLAVQNEYYPLHFHDDAGQETYIMGLRRKQE